MIFCVLMFGSDWLPGSPSSTDVISSLSPPATLLMIGLVVGFLILCAACAFSSKRKYAAAPEPVRLLSTRQNKLDAYYTETSGTSKGENRSNRGTAARSHSNNLRASSPNWRNSSLSRELPAIPDSQDGAIQSESASNVYACLDDVRQQSRPEPDPQSSDSSQENPFPINRLANARVHPYDKIGTPSTSTSGMPLNHAHIGVPSRNNHAQILLQLDNDPTSYGANYGGVAQSVMSYTSITVRTPLTDLRTRRSSEDGYTKVSEDENHLYAQVGEEYGGSTASDHLASHHIYNELYSEIDPHHLPFPLAPSTSSNNNYDSDSLINPYATSASLYLNNAANSIPLPSTSAGPPDLPLSQEDIEKLYAKISKPPIQQRPHQSPVHSSGEGSSLPNGKTSGQVSNPSPTLRHDTQACQSASGESLSNQRLSLVGTNECQSSDVRENPGQLVTTSANGPKPYVRKEHVYERLPNE